MPPNFEDLKRFIHRIPYWLKNRYAVSALVLIAWITFFDSFDLFTTWKNQRILSDMEDQKVWYTAEIEKTKEELLQLTSDKKLLEKFARERYLMKRDNEDIYVLVPAD